MKTEVSTRNLRVRLRILNQVPFPVHDLCSPARKFMTMCGCSPAFVSIYRPRFYTLGYSWLWTPGACQDLLLDGRSVTVCVDSS